MKKIIIALGITFICATASNAQTEKCEKTVAPEGKEFVKTRGKNPHIKKDFEKGKLIIIPSKNLPTRGKTPCQISFLNMNEKKVNVYVDSVYQGTLMPKSIGTLEMKWKYSNVYCITEDLRRCWFDYGSCSCLYSFELK